MRPRLDSLCRAVSSMGQQDSLIVELFKEHSFLTQLVCGSAGIAVPGLVVIAKLLQRLDLAMTRATATDVIHIRLGKLAKSVTDLLEQLVPAASIRAKQPAVVALLDRIRLWLASVTEFVEDDCKLRSFDSLRKIFHAQKRFTTATAIAAAFDDIRTSMQAAGFAVGLHLSEQVDTVQTSIAALQAQSNKLLQMMEQMAAKDPLPAALKGADTMAVSPEACKDEVAALAKGSNLLGQQTPTVEPGSCAGLVAQLSSTCSEQHQQAAKAIHIFVDDSQQNKDAIIAAGALPLLANLLRSEKLSVLQPVLEACNSLAAFGSQQNYDAVIAAGVLPLVVSLLRSNMAGVQEVAARSVQALTQSSQQSADAVISLGALPLLVSMLASGQLGKQEQSALALLELAFSSEQNRAKIFAAGAVPVLAQSLKSESPETQKAAAVTLAALAADGGQQMKAAIIATGALHWLGVLMAPQCPATHDAAACVLMTLADGSQQSQDAIISADVLPLLVALLRSDNSVVQERAATAIRILAFSQANADVIVSAGAVPLLVGMLKADKLSVQTDAAKAFVELASHCSQRDVIVAAGGLPVLVALLRSAQPTEEPHTTARTAIALVSIALDSQLNMDAIIAKGTLPIFASLALEPPVQAPAAYLSMRLAQGSEENQNALIAAGLLPALVGLLQTADSIVQDFATQAVESLAAGLPCVRNAVIAVGFLPILKGLLKSSNTNVQTHSAQAIEFLTTDI
ncbi:TPA: hypothetical protein ACH3X3_009114 [Trebouxia sp. C0006]